MGYPVPSTYLTGLARVDWQMGPKDSLTLRYTINDNEDINAASNCAFGPVFCGNSIVKELNLAAAHTHVFSGSLLDELRVSYIKRDLQGLQGYSSFC